MKLYYAPGASSLSPHIVLREAELRFDLERVDLKTHRTASGADFRGVTHKAYVPALLLDDGEVLTEGPVILQYLGDRVPEKKLVPPNGSMVRYRLMEWLNFIATELDLQLQPLFLRDLSPRYGALLRGRVGNQLLYLQDVLEDRAYLMGETFTVCDAYLFTMLQWTRKVGMDLQLWPNLFDYEIRVAERPSVRAAFAAEGLNEQHNFKRSA
jgi:glutathione S-transferase